jgi:deoxyhypusine synthase
MIKRIIVAMLFMLSLAVVAAEPPLPSDSLQSDSIVFAADSTDSLQTGGGVVKNVLIPVTLIAATAGIFILLFTTRSK